MVRTISGKLITAIASTTAFHVKTTSMPMRSKARPTTLLSPNSCSSRKPVATGGSTSGSDSSVSTTGLPGNERRASSHAAAIPAGSATSVESTPISVVNAARPRMPCSTIRRLPSGSPPPRRWRARRGT